MADSAMGSPTSEARSASEMRQILDKSPLDRRSRARVHSRPPSTPFDSKRPRLSLDSAAESVDSCGSSRASGDSHSVHSDGGGDLDRSHAMIKSLLHRVQKCEGQRDKAREDAMKHYAWVKKMKPQVDECNKLKEKIVQLKPLQGVNAKLQETIATLEKEKNCKMAEMTNLKAQFAFLDQQLQAAFKAQEDLQAKQDEVLQKAVQQAKEESRREAEQAVNQARDIETSRLKRQLRDLNGKLKNEIEPELTTLLLEEQTFKERLEARDKVLLATQDELKTLQRRVREELEPEITLLKEHHSEREAELQVELEATRTELVRRQERQQRAQRAVQKAADLVQHLKLRLKLAYAERDRLKEEIASQAVEARGREDERDALAEERVRSVETENSDLQQKLDIVQEACKSLLNGKRDLELQLTELRTTHAQCPRVRPPSRERSPSMPPGVPFPARLRTPHWQPDLLTSTFSYAQVHQENETSEFEQEDESTDLIEEPGENEHEHLHFEIEQIPVIKTEPADED